MIRKMKRILKNIINNKKSGFILGLILGVIVSATGAYAATSIYSNNVFYDNTNSGLTATNVQEALDEAYLKLFPPATPVPDLIENLYNDGSTINTVHIGQDSSNPQVHLNATQGIMLDNNGDYRYWGKDPDNYVLFNEEIWKIIGVFNNVDDGTGKKETRMKIIRYYSIGSYSYDSSSSSVNSGYGVNDWSQADLNTELNTLYYNSTTGTCYNGSRNSSTTCDFSSTGLGSEAQSMIGDAVFHLGGGSRYDGLYADDYYNFERGTTKTWTGKVGLMYPSDYVYATDLSRCSSAAYNYDSGGCYSSDWLYNSSYTQWTITPYSSGVFYVYFKGSVFDSYGYKEPFRAYGVRPVVYLKSNVGIASGAGTMANPYTLGLLTDSSE